MIYMPQNVPEYAAPVLCVIISFLLIFALKRNPTLVVSTAISGCVVSHLHNMYIYDYYSALYNIGESTHVLC